VISRQKILKTLRIGLKLVSLKALTAILLKKSQNTQISLGLSEDIALFET
jgi:hypothetical protein